MHTYTHMHMHMYMHARTHTCTYVQTIAYILPIAVARLGVKSTAVYTEHDTRALHVRCADEAVALPVGGAGYLDLEAIVELAKQVGADCVHPGYGFLSERSDFASMLEAEGIAFVGPTPKVLELFGDKPAARALAKECNIPVLQGSDVAFSNAADALAFVEKEGMQFPLLLKAAYGGGGRGIRTVQSVSDFVAQFERCSSEAASAFGKSQVFVEELVRDAKHIEVQILGDAGGQVSHLFERDCTVQLRNQKLIEIAPARGIAAELRDRLTSEAVTLAKAAKYTNAGTVEFLVEGSLANPQSRFSFIELNPRVQVEHTITEQVTGIDIVQSQFMLAAGCSLESLGLTNVKLLGGHSLQARVSLSPTVGSSGTLEGYHEPNGPGIRVDSAAYAGYSPPTVYDPLIAKLIVTTTSPSAASFEQLLARTTRALDEFWVEGIGTTIPLIQRVLGHEAFIANTVTTSFLAENPHLLGHALPPTTSNASLLFKESSAAQGMSHGDARAAAADRRSPPPTLPGAVETSLGGSVVSTKVKPGDLVSKGDVLVVMTAMKMETVVRSPHAGRVALVLAEDNAVLHAGEVIAIVDQLEAEEFLAAAAANEGNGATDASEASKGAAAAAAAAAADPDRDGMQWAKSVEQIHARRKLALEMGGEKGVARQHSLGRLTLRERIDDLLDSGSLREIGRIAGGSIINEDGEIESFTPGNFLLGTGKINSRPVVVGGEDFTISGGSPTTAGYRKSVYAEGLTLQLQIPLVRLHEGGGGSVAGAGNRRDKSQPAAPAGDPVFSRPRFESVAQCLASVPVATAALGPVAGLPASRLVASHFSVMVAHAQVITAGPKVVERALGYAITKEELGGIGVHKSSGVVDNIVETEADAFKEIRTFLSYLPANVNQLPPVVVPCNDSRDRMEEELLSIVPSNRKQTFDIRKIFRLVFDKAGDGECGGTSFFEIGNTEYGQTQVTGFARINGQPVGVFGNDSRYFAGALTWDASLKLKRFIELCETFHLPIVSFVDEPGFMIGLAAESAGTIRHGTAAVLTAQSCSVPWATVHVRKSYGVAAAAHYGPDAYVLAWPSAEAGALPVESGVAVAFARQLRVVAEDEGVDAAEAMRAELEERFSRGLSPFPRAESFAVHDLIDPRETRPLLCDWIELAQLTLPSLLGPRSFPYKP